MIVQTEGVGGFRECAFIDGDMPIVLANILKITFESADGDGIEINHQRSKSLDFELAFAEYLQHAVTNEVKYFSLLR